MITSAGTQQLASSFTAAPIDGFNTAAGTVDLSANYQPTSSYSPGSSSQNFSPAPSQDPALICSPAANCTGAPAYYYIYVPTLTNCTSSATDDNCYRYVRVSATSGPGGTDERQNFANWLRVLPNPPPDDRQRGAITMADPVLQQARVTWRDFWTCQDLTPATRARAGTGPSSTTGSAHSRARSRPISTNGCRAFRPITRHRPAGPGSTSAIISATRTWVPTAHTA